MNRALRTVVACLLLIALPLQGYAAASMLFCGAGATQGAALDHEHDRAGAQDHHHHDHHGDDDAAVAADDTGGSNLHDAMHGKCSVCSSCCGVAALPSALIPASAAVPDATVFPDLGLAVPGDGPALLERPPRLNLA